MENVLKSDPRFTNFVPQTAAEAVDRYVRCRKNGLKPMLVPECLIECAKGLNQRQMNLFEDWIINPNGSLDKLDLVPVDSINKDNDRVFADNLHRMKLGPPPGPTPPLPAESPYVDDEKMEVDDEKTKEVVREVLDAIIEKACSLVKLAQPDSTSSEDPCNMPST